MRNKYLYLIEQYQIEHPYPITEFESGASIFVYLILNPISKLCKIGITNQPRIRHSQLQNQSGMPLFPLLVLELEAGFDESGGMIEKFLHRFYKEKRKYGEWFDLTIKDIIKIKNLFWSIEGVSNDDNLKNYKNDTYEVSNGISIINQIYNQINN